VALVVVRAFTALVIDEVAHTFGLTAIAHGSAEYAMRRQKLGNQKTPGSHQPVFRRDKQLFEI
jgi:hypothetical protein